MTNEEVIRIIKSCNMCDFPSDYTICEIQQAIEMAISALSAKQNAENITWIVNDNGEAVAFKNVKIDNVIKICGILQGKKEDVAEWITKWDEEEREERHYCTNCNKHQLFQTEFCSHCGAKMKGETE